MGTSSVGSVDAYGRPLDVLRRLRDEAERLDAAALDAAIVELRERAERVGLVGEPAMRLEVYRDARRAR